MSNAPSTKNLEKALGIGDDVSKISNITSDDEKKKQFEERQARLKDIQDQFRKKRSDYQEDKDFVKDMYKELAETGMIAVRIMQEEAGMTGDYKNVEAMAAASNAVAQALDGLKSVEIDEEKLRIERDKVEIRRISSNKESVPGITSAAGGVTNVFVGSTFDLLKAIKDAEKDAKNAAIKDAEVIKENIENK
jgi:hypothetical protein